MAKRAARRYGYPGNRALRRRALRLAQSSVPTAGSIRRQYGRSIGDVGGFTEALVSLLRGSPGTGAYDESIAQQQGVDDAALERLESLGPEYAGAGVAAGAQGDSAMSRLLAGRAAAGAYSARQPGIAASRGALAQTGLVNARNEALRQRSEAIRQNFPNALSQVQAQALALAQFNADDFYKQQALALDWMNARTSAANAGGEGGRDFDDVQQVRGGMADFADMLFGRTRTIPGNPKVFPPTEDREVSDRPTYTEAFAQVRQRFGAELRGLGYSRSQAARIIRQILRSAGFQPPPRRHRGAPYDWQ